MALVKLMVILFSSIALVYTDYQLNLYDRELKKYLSVIEIGLNDHYIKAVKDQPDMFCRFDFVTSRLPYGKVLLQIHFSGKYFNVTSNDYIRPTNGSNISSAEFDFIMESDPHRKKGARIALKARNGLYCAAEDKYIKASSSTPVFFDIYPLD